MIFVLPFSFTRYPEAEITAMAATYSSRRPGPSISVALGLSSGMVYVLTADLSGRDRPSLVDSKVQPDRQLRFLHLYNGPILPRCTKHTRAHIVPRTDDDLTAFVFE